MCSADPVDAAEAVAFTAPARRSTPPLAAAFVLAGQGAAPAAATIEHNRSLWLDEVPGAGPLAAAVPGAVVAWLDLLATHGTWELADVLTADDIAAYCPAHEELLALRFRGVDVLKVGPWSQDRAPLQTLAILGAAADTHGDAALDPSTALGVHTIAEALKLASPIMLARDGHAFEALGTPGGNQQDQWQLLYLLRRIVGGYEPQQAIDAPMFHTDAMVASFEPRTVQTASLTVESRLGEPVIAELRDRGHEVTVMGPWSLGRLSCVDIDRGRGWMYAAANSRGNQGYAAGR